MADNMFKLKLKIDSNLMVYWFRRLTQNRISREFKSWLFFTPVSSIEHVDTLHDLHDLFMPPKWLGVYLLLARQGYKSLCHLINTADESIWIPNLNRLLITLFMPYHLNITYDVFVVWLSKIFKSVRITHAGSSLYIILRPCPNFAQTLLKLCSNFAWTLPELCLNFVQTLPKLFPNFA